MDSRLAAAIVCLEQLTTLPIGVETELGPQSYKDLHFFGETRGEWLAFELLKALGELPADGLRAFLQDGPSLTDHRRKFLDLDRIEEECRKTADARENLARVLTRQDVVQRGCEDTAIHSESSS